MGIIHGSSGIVYFITSSNGLTKIGATTNLKNRLNSMMTSSPCDLKLIMIIRHPNAVELENTLHDLLKDLRVKGEWFRLTPFDTFALRDWLYEYMQFKESKEDFIELGCSSEFMDEFNEKNNPFHNIPEIFDEEEIE